MHRGLLCCGPPNGIRTIYWHFVWCLFALLLLVLVFALFWFSLFRWDSCVSHSIFRVPSCYVPCKCARVCVHLCLCLWTQRHTHTHARQCAVCKLCSVDDCFSFALLADDYCAHSFTPSLIMHPHTRALPRIHNPCARLAPSREQ